MGPSRLFILRPVGTTLLMAALLLIGIVAYNFLPVSALPEVDYPTIQVSTFYPGASPDVMTTAVTAPLERQFGEMPGLSQMSSISSGGASVITLQFDLDLSLDVAEQEVQAAINAATSLLPSDLPAPPVYAKVNPADTPVLTLAITSKTLPLPQVEDVADIRMAQKLSQVNGVGLVSITGGQRPAVRVQINPRALAAYGLAIDDIRTDIGNQNTDTPKGNFDGPAQNTTINNNDQLQSADEYKRLIIAYKNGDAVRLQNVATVVQGTENAELAAWAGRTPAIILNIQRQPGSNVIAVVAALKKLLPKLEQSLPAALDVAVLSDQTTTIRASVADVEFELGLSVVLVVLVIFVFLRTLPATLIPSLSVPLSLVGTLAGMYAFGFSLDNLSLMSLTIATGFVVDDAIVMIENIARYIEAGEAPLEAARRGSGEIGFTIISLTVSLIAVLIPLLFMGDVVGRLFHEFAITLAVTIILSAVVSLTLVPMLCALIMRHHTEEDRSRFDRAAERGFEWIIRQYDRGLIWVLDHQGLTLIVFFVTLDLTVFQYTEIPKGFFPVEDTGVIQGITEAAQDVSFGAMAAQQQQLADTVLHDRDVANLSSFIGVDGTNTMLNSGRMLISLKPRGRRSDAITAVIRRLQDEIAGVPHVTMTMQPVQDLTIDSTVGRAQYNFFLENPDLPLLNQWVPHLVQQMQSMPVFRDVSTDLSTNGRQLQMIIDRPTAARFGITPSSIDNALYDSFGPAHRLHALHPIQPVPRHHERRHEQRAQPQRRAAHHLPAVLHRHQRPGAARSPGAPERDERPAADRTPGAVSLCGDLLQPRTRHVAGQRGERDRAGRTGDRTTGKLHLILSRRAVRVPEVARQRVDADSGRGCRRLHRARRTLREFRPPDHHPLHVAVSRRGRAAGTADRRRRSRHHRHHRHHPADRHREEERDHDDRLRARA